MRGQGPLVASSSIHVHVCGVYVTAGGAAAALVPLPPTAPSLPSPTGRGVRRRRRVAHLALCGPHPGLVQGQVRPRLQAHRGERVAERQAACRACVCSGGCSHGCLASAWPAVQLSEARPPRRLLADAVCSSCRFAHACMHEWSKGPGHDMPCHAIALCHALPARRTPAC